MKVFVEISVRDFEAWSGAKDTQKRIIEEGMCEDFDNLIDELYPDGIDETKLNDILWFEPDWIYENLGITDEEEDEEEEEEEN